METKPNPSYCSAFYKITAAIGLSIVASLGLLSFVFAEPIHTRLNPDLVEGGSIKFYDSSPDGIHIAYIADQETKGTDELYIVSIDGGTPTKLSPTSLAGRSVIRFRFTLDSKYLVYSGEQTVDNQYSIYSVLAAGGNTIDLVGELPTGQSAVFYSARQPISPDGKWLVYTIEERNNTSGPHETALRSTPINQRSTITLTPPFVEGGGIWIFKISPDSKNVIYVADQEADEIPALYSVPIAGGAPTKISIVLQTGDSMGEFYYSPDGTQVIYSVITGGKFKLFRVASTGGQSVLLSESSSFISFRGYFSPDGHQLLFATHERSGTLVEYTYKLFIASLDGKEPVLLSSTADTEGTNTSIEDFQLTPDGNTVFFSYSDNGNGSRYLYSVPSNGGAKTKIVDSTFGFPDDYYFRISQDGKHIVHSVFDYGSQLGNLYRTDLNTSATITLTGNDYDGPPFYLSPDGSGVFFRSKATQDVPAKIVSVPFTNTTVMTVSIDTSFDVGYSLSIPAPLLHEGKVCQIYTLQNPSRDLYSSCFDAVWKHQVYLPVIGR